MPRIRGGLRGRRTGCAARRMDWYGAAVSVAPANIAAGGTSLAYILLPSQMLELTDPTLIRTRGIFKVYLAATGTVAFGGFGLLPWSDINDTVPTESIPNPFANSNLDWIWHTFWHVEGGATIDAAKSYQEYLIDSKAMRRLGSDRGVLAVFANAPGSTGSARAYYATRCLVKE